MNMGSAVYATPVPAHGALFLNNRNQLFALAANGRNGEDRDRSDDASRRSRRHDEDEDLCSRRSLRDRRGLVASCMARGPCSRRQPDWPQFRGDARLTGVATAALPATLTLKWTYEAGDIIESSAAIADGTVYVGAGNGDLLAIDLETGKLRWKYATGSQIGESSPAVGGGRVFVGDLAGIVHAVDARSGKPRVDVQDRRRGEVVAGRSWATWC